MTLYSTSLSTLSSIFTSSLVSNFLSFWALTSRTWDNQASKCPQSVLSSDALMPPQPQCPVTRICSTFSLQIAYWMTARTFTSAGDTTLAIFLCTNISPGLRPTISLAGTRLSAQPIHRYLGAWILTSFEKKSGSSWVIWEAQLLLWSRRTLMPEEIFFIYLFQMTIIKGGEISLKGEYQLSLSVDTPPV